MPEITIPASEVRKGDVISIGGDLRTVTDLRTTNAATVTMFVATGGNVTTGVIDFPVDQMVIIDRPDPDAGVIEAIVTGIFPWVSHVNQMEVARAALAAYRGYCNRTQA